MAIHTARRGERSSDFHGVAAVANAVYHATGIRIRELPIRLEKLLVA